VSAAFGLLSPMPMQSATLGVVDRAQGEHHFGTPRNKVDLAFVVRTPPGDSVSLVRV